MSDAKKAILARRAKFVAAALAGLSCGKEPRAEPTVCLSTVITVDGAPTIEPRVCLTPALPPEDASAPSEDAGGAPDASPDHVPPAGPSGKPKPKPTPCLKIAAPKDRQG